MIIKPIYQTTHVNVEMTQKEVDALKALYSAIQDVVSAWVYVLPSVPELMRLSVVFDKAPKIIEQPQQVKPNKKEVD